MSYSREMQLRIHATISYLIDFYIKGIHPELSWDKLCEYVNVINSGFGDDITEFEYANPGYLELLSELAVHLEWIFENNFAKMYREYPEFVRAARDGYFKDAIFVRNTKLINQLADDPFTFQLE